MRNSKSSENGPENFGSDDRFADRSFDARSQRGGRGFSHHFGGGFGHGPRHGHHHGAGPLRKIFFLLAAGLSFGAFAGCHRGTPEQRAAWITDRVADKLLLDPTQKAKLNVVKDALLARKKAMEEGRAKLTEEFKQQLNSDTFDNAKVTALLTERLKELEAALPDLTARYGEFHNSLRPEQRQRVASVLLRWQERMER